MFLYNLRPTEGVEGAAIRPSHKQQHRGPVLC